MTLYLIEYKLNDFFFHLGVPATPEGSLCNRFNLETNAANNLEKQSQQPPSSSTVYTGVFCLDLVQ